MLFSLFDVKAQLFGPLFQSETDDAAKRIFIEALKSGRDAMLAQYPEDFVLYRVGDFIPSTGKICAEPSPYKVMTGFECIRLLKPTETVSSKELTVEGGSCSDLEEVCL